VIGFVARWTEVPACEYNPIEAVNTNINGTCNVVDAALDCRVPRVINLSTDKATAPLNIYGATKLVAEKLFVHANSYAGDRDQRFACVRYGNVLGSRGSVVPLFRDQFRSGIVTVTDGRMTRFWITLDQSVRFVISCLESMRGGEVFIPKLPSMRVSELAAAIAPGCRIESIGIRSGEKLHESLVSADESRLTVELDDRYIMLAGDPASAAARHWRQRAASLPEGFAYASDTNDWWLSADEILELLDDDPACPERRVPRPVCDVAVQPAVRR
jgi:UDP-N-acetylglucosamine 4,6-dehydratase